MEKISTVEENFNILGDTSTLDFSSLINAEAGSYPDISLENSNSLLALRIDDLLPDAGGNIVMCDEAGIKEMTIFSDATIVENGISKTQFTDGGLDVSGMAFYSFDSGVTLYYPSDVHISILS
jgi:hypothetical protein